MHYHDLRDFLSQLETLGELKRIALPVSPHLEMTEICDRALRCKGPALYFEQPTGHTLPVIGNLFGTVERIALGMGKNDISGLRELGETLAFLREPKPPSGLGDAWQQLPLLKQIMALSPKQVSKAPCQTHVLVGNDIDLSRFPIQTCWPDDVGPLITWGLVVTQGPHQSRSNVGIYRQQVIDRNRVIIRWLRHRGGALDYQAWRRKHPDEKFPIAVVLGADPATTLAAVMPIPDHLSEYGFAGFMRGKKLALVPCQTHGLLVPASAEIVLEGYIYPNDVAEEGPFGDHTGYYNEVEFFPVMTIERITLRDQPIYHSTYTGRPPDEPAVLGMALNEVFVPLLKKQFPEVIDFYLPPEGCSYRLAVVSINKQYAGHAKQIMMGIWSMLKQFSYTKFIVVVDEDIDVRNWNDVIWAITTRMDPARDTLMLENTPIDYLDFASPTAGLGSKMGLDATNKWPGETSRVWGKTINMSDDVKQRIDDIWSTLGLS